MTIVDVMSPKLVSVSPGDTVRHAIAQMVAENVGAVAVCEGSRLVGVLSERDVLRLAERGADFDHLPVGDVMTTRLVTVSRDDDVLDGARLMGEHTVRHLPVVEGENLLGMVGIRDVLAVLAERLWREHDPKAHDTVRGLLQRERSRSR